MTTLNGRARPMKGTTPVFTVDDELPPHAVLQNAADAHCEVCHGIGLYKGGKCPCVPRIALIPKGRH